MNFLVLSQNYQVVEFAVGTYQSGLTDASWEGETVKGTSFHINLESIDNYFPLNEAIDYLITLPNGEEHVFRKWIKSDKDKIKSFCSHHALKEDKHQESALPEAGEYKLKVIFNYKKDNEEVVAKSSFELDEKEVEHFLQPVDQREVKHEFKVEKAFIQWGAFEEATSYQVNLFKMMSDLPAGATSDNNIALDKGRKKYETININAYNQPPNPDFKSAHNQNQCPISYESGAFHRSHQQISTKKKKKVKVLE